MRSPAVRESCRRPQTSAPAPCCPTCTGSGESRPRSGRTQTLPGSRALGSRKSTAVGISLFVNVAHRERCGFGGEEETVCITSSTDLNTARLARTNRRRTRSSGMVQATELLRETRFLPSPPTLCPSPSTLLTAAPGYRSLPSRRLPVPLQAWPGPAAPSGSRGKRVRHFVVLGCCRPRVGVCHTFDKRLHARFSLVHPLEYSRHSPPPTGARAGSRSSVSHSSCTSGLVMYLTNSQAASLLGEPEKTKACSPPTLVALSPPSGAGTRAMSQANGASLR